MKLFKKSWMGALILATGFMFTSSVDARQLGYKVDGADVDDVTTSACATSNQTVDMFGNGVSMDQVWQLEVESGSPGSGAWSEVTGYTDIFPTVQGGAAVGGTTQVARYVSTKRACFRLRMTTDTAGTAQVQLVIDGNAPSATPGIATHMEYFDDFNRSVLAVAALGSTIDYLSFVGDGTGSSVVGIGEISPEGILTMTGGDDGDAEDTVEVTLGTSAYGGLVSAGLVIVEYRASVEDITAGDWFLGLTEDVTADGSEDLEYDVDTNVVTDVTEVNSSIAFAFSSDAVNPTSLIAVSTNATNVGNAADEYTLAGTPVAATYQVLRIEVDTAGHAFWYVDGVLEGAEPLAVATTATLMPYMAAGSADDCAAGCGVTKVDIDYLLWVVARPDTT